MKFKFSVMVLAMTIPSVLWAAANFLDTDPVYVIVDNEREVSSAPLTRN